MKITGQILKEQRVRKQITLNEVSIATKINTKVLQAMEEGNLEHLPQKTFLRGFVRSYAKYLQLNVEDILNQFSEEMGTTNPQLPLSEEGGKRSENSPGENRATPMPNGEGSSTGRLLLVAGAVLLIVVIFIVHRTVEKYERESQKASLPTDATTPVDGTALNPAISITGMPDPNATGGPLVTPMLSGTPPATTLTPEATLSITPAPTKAVSAVAVPLSTPTSVPTPTASAKPTATPKPTLTPKPLPTTKPSPTPKPTVTPKPSPAPKSSPTPKPTSAPKASDSEDDEPTPTPRKGSQEVIIESLDNVSIDFTIDGGPTQSIKLKAEQIHTFKAKSQLTLEIANGGAVNLIYNGKDRGVPGTPGKPTKLKFP